MESLEDIPCQDAKKAAAEGKAKMKRAMKVAKASPLARLRHRGTGARGFLIGGEDRYEEKGPRGQSAPRPSAVPSVYSVVL